jgi:hypothetical protein
MTPHATQGPGESGAANSLRNEFRAAASSPF